MKFEKVGMTPAWARQLMDAHNAGWAALVAANPNARRWQREVKPWLVRNYRNEMAGGRWKTTQDGIGVADSGRVVQGMHRLLALSELPEGTVIEMILVTGVSEDTFDVLDRGLRRSTADVLGIDRDLAAVGHYLHKIVHHREPAGSLFTDLYEPFIKWAEPAWNLFIGNKKHTRVFASATVRAAAVVRINQGHNKDDFVVKAYNSLVHRDYAMMPPACQALNRQVQEQDVGSSRSPDLFCRALRAFDYSRKDENIRGILVKDRARTLDLVRQFILDDMGLHEKPVVVEEKPTEEKETKIQPRRRRTSHAVALST